MNRTRLYAELFGYSHKCVGLLRSLVILTGCVETHATLERLNKNISDQENRTHSARGVIKRSQKRTIRHDRRPGRNAPPSTALVGKR